MALNARQELAAAAWCPGIDCLLRQGSAPPPAPAAKLAPNSYSSICLNPPASLLAPLLQLSGAIIAPVALLFMAYALYMYKKRTYQVGGQG